MARPSGTVTFLFTDIVGSTRRWEADSEAMGAARDGVPRSASDAVAATVGIGTGEAGLLP